MKTIIKFLIFLTLPITAQSQGVIFNGDFSPAEGLITPQEKPYREEICLNGYWNLQIVPVPETWKSGSGEAPELPSPVDGKWETTKIKIPSPVNVNNWGNGNNTGEGSPFPYSPSSVYYPGYPKHWDHARMAWLKKTFTLPAGWNGKRLILHFEAVAGECVVLVNGREVVRNFDSHLPFEADITDWVNRNGENEVLAGVRHTKLFDKKHPDYKYFGATYPTGSNTDDLLGIWQDVFLFALPALRVTDVFIKPHVSQNELEIQFQITNQTAQKRKINVQGTVKEWINKANTNTPLSAAEINWDLGQTALTCSNAIEIAAGATQTFSIRTPVNNQLKYWSPGDPNLYTLLLQVYDKKTTYDLKATRFGWRELTIAGDEFHLNGKKIQCFGDIQHPFGAYICSRRFACAWYQMIKDFGGNAVRPHAQPWPRVYYDLADEMGLMVLDETALFGSSIRLNLEEDITWQRSEEHLKRLVLRDRNHPSVIGWSAGNEMFAIALLNKPPKEVSTKWDDKLVDLALSVKQTDDTRDFITLDGNRDMEGRLPVWSKHFSHGLKLEDLPKNLNKPLIVGESGATYYGRPIQLYPFVGDKAFQSYYGRNEALAMDVYQNVKQMALPYLSYFSPSEVSWFGIEHLNLGYHDYSRLPNSQDGIFAGKPYEEGRPGYQYERIPPYVTTFNPGLDPGLPLYKPLPMFLALQAALNGKESPWEQTPAPASTPAPVGARHALPLPPEKPALPTLYHQAYFAGNTDSSLYKKLTNIGLEFSKTANQPLLIIDAENVSEAQLRTAHLSIEKIKKNGGMIWLMLAGRQPSAAAQALLPFPLETTNRTATSLDNNRQTTWGKYFDAPDLYFAEVKEGDRQILKQGLAGEMVNKGTVILSASNVDWSLFNEQPENRKCAQVVLYEHLQKPSGVALLTCPYGKATLVVSTLDYRPEAPEYTAFWRNLLSAMQIKWNPVESQQNSNKNKEHNLLLDGPVDQAGIQFPADASFDIFKTLDKKNIAYTVSDFAGYQCATFQQYGRECKIVKPRKTAANHPWIWRARFFGHEPQTDIALLERGYHLVYCDQAERLGNKKCIQEWDSFYDLLREGGLNQKAVLEGMSRGAVYVLNWAAAHPQQVAAVYVDNPLLDMKAMYFGPDGKEKPENEITIGIRENWGIDRSQINNFNESPIDKIDAIVKGKYPILILCAELDEAAVNSQNTFPFEKKIKEKGGNITVIVKKGAKHHPHSFPDPAPIVEFIEKAVRD